MNYEKQRSIFSWKAREREAEKALPRREGESAAAHVLRTLTEVEKEHLVRCLESRITRNGDCWIWSGAKQNGYGFLHLRKILHRVSRISFRIFIGHFDYSKFVCHTCDTPLCVNPSHLFTGTPKDNMQDMTQKGRHWMQKKVTTHCKRGHEYTPENTIHHSKGKQCRTCKNLRRVWRRPILKSQGRNPSNA